MCTFDPDMAKRSMAPNLSKADKLAYIAGEREFVEDLLKDATDCKWVYQALIECALLIGKVEGSFAVEATEDVRKWLVELRKLDPLRKGRWDDLEKSLA